MPYLKASLPKANLESIFSCSKQPVFIVGPELRVVYANSYAIKLVGKTKLKNLHCYELFHDNRTPPANCPWKTPVCGLRVEETCKLKKGRVENYCKIDAVPIMNPDGKIIGALHMMEVTTDAVRMAEELIERNEELKLINELSSILAKSLDLEKVLKAALKRLLKWSNFEAGAVYLAKDSFIEINSYLGIGNSFLKEMRRMPLGQGLSGLAAKVKKTITSEDAQYDIRTRPSVIAQEGLHATVAVPIIAKKRVVGVLTLASRKIRKFNSKEINLLETIADHMAVVIENASLHKKTIALSRTDDLTGLFNSRYFEEILQKEINIAKRKNEQFALMMLDIDNLKRVNDAYGHDGGNILLKKFSQVLQDNLRNYDFFARYGGDEFVVLLPSSDEKTARAVAGKLKRKIVATRIFGFDIKPLMTTSIGIAIFPKAASTMISLIKAADIAMYKAKQEGKNRICVFEPSLLPDMKFDSEHLERIAHNADFNSLQALVTAIDLKDKFTGSHSSEVSRLAVILAKKIGLSKKEMEELRVAALLHDVGKIGISDRILLKTSSLTKKEFDEIKKHPKLGVSILKSSKEFRNILPIVLYHHERWDGRGYPYGVKGQNIPLRARIVAIADAFEAMTANRPYRRAMSKKYAITQLWKFANHQFDPELIKEFTAIINDSEKESTSSFVVSESN